ncbi:acyl-CoA carboxylase subunit epsilon [Rathayibacter sp. YIM 133350]|uniref:acyl-CoA carboxylase subunit epsilon n=1 Tax=Rathayibacter sp. YIM 133350 TaxID=3131992 RepID=UPI00307F590F
MSIESSPESFDPAALRFRTARVSAEETAAITAVLDSLLREESEHARQVNEAGVSAWQRSQRSLRAPLTPGPGRWRGFDA